MQEDRHLQCKILTDLEIQKSLAGFFDMNVAFLHACLFLIMLNYDAFVIS